MSEIVYGIDLGTTNCVCARAEGPGLEVEVIPMEGESSALMSAIYLAESQGRLRAWIGSMAWERYAIQPEKALLIEMSKRYIGVPRHQARTWRLNELEIDAIDAASLLLYRIRQQIEQGATDLPPARVVVSHPRDFTLGRKSATAKAVEVAGLELLDTINEPEAAAYVHFAPGRERLPGKTLVFDLGGGTLDIALLEVPERGRPRVIGGHGVASLGGKDWDDVMLTMILEQAQEQHQADGVDYRGDITHRQLRELIRLARTWKEIAVGRIRHRKLLQSRLRDGGQLQTRLEIRIDEWEARCRPLVEKCWQAIDRALKDAACRTDEVVRVLPVGGSVRLRSIGELLEQRFGRRVEPIDGPNAVSADLAVACGAARHASFLAARGEPSGRRTGTLVEQAADHAPISSLPHGISVLAVREGRDVLETVVAKGAELPTSAERLFRVVDAGATLVVEVYEGPAGPLPPGAEASALLEFPGELVARVGDSMRIVVEVKASGRITVRAHHERSGTSRDVSMKAGRATSWGDEVEVRRARLASIEVI